MKLTKSLTTVMALGAMLLVTGFARADHHATKDIVDTAVEAGSFTTLVKAVQAADLVDALKGEGPFTVFAPTDAAFAKVPAATLQALLKPENKEQLKAVLLYHVVSGAVMADDVVNLDSAETLNGENVHIQLKDGAVMINNAEVVKADIPTSNGVIHVIDTVMLPANLGELSDYSCYPTRSHTQAHHHVTDFQLLDPRRHRWRGVGLEPFVGSERQLTLSGRPRLGEHHTAS